jgi:hypothetical protein
VKIVACLRAVAGFEKIFPYNIVLRHMTIAAGSPFTVAAVHPRSILRVHHVAVDAGFGIVGQIGSSFAGVKNEDSQPDHDTHNNSCRRAPCWGWKQIQDQNFFIFLILKVMNYLMAKIKHLSI